MISTFKFQISNLVAKLRTLPESKKVIIFFAVMGIAALVAGFVGVRVMMHDFSKIKDLGKSVQLPAIEIPEVLKKLGAPKDETADWKTYVNEKMGFSMKYPPNLRVQESDVASDVASEEGILTVRNVSDLDKELSELEKITSDTENTKEVEQREIVIDGIGAKDISYKNLRPKPMGDGPLWEINIYMPEKNMAIFVQAKHQESLDIFRTMISTFKFTN